MPAVLGASIESIRAGAIKPIAIFDVKQNEKLPEVPLVTAYNEDYKTYLPWGPFFGVFAPKGTPDAVVAKLSDAYAQAAKSPDFIELMDNRGFTMMGISGAEATEFLSKWQQGTAWLLQDAGLTKASPEDFGIKRP